MIAPGIPSEAVDGDQMGVDGWINVAMSDMGDMNEFSVRGFSREGSCIPATIFCALSSPNASFPDP